MAFREHNTPWRAPFLRANFTRIATILAWIHRTASRRAHPHIKDISPRLARDIGLNPADLEHLHHTLPSQTTHHPRS